MAFLIAWFIFMAAVYWYGGFFDTGEKYKAKKEAYKKLMEDPNYVDVLGPPGV